jgi:hypothetical protein
MWGGCTFTAAVDDHDDDGNSAGGVVVVGIAIDTIVSIIDTSDIIW